MYRQSLIWIVLVCVAAVGAGTARAHFIWLELVSADEGDPQARLYFSEDPAPGEPRLIGKVTHAKAWLRDAAGDIKPLKLSAADDDLPALVATCADASGSNLEGLCDYGLFGRGAAPMLLQYYAKHLGGGWQKNPALARAEKLKLDIVPKVSGDELTLQVLYAGEPVADNPVNVIDPNGDEQELETDAEGKVTVPAEAGRWAARAGLTRDDQSGERDGKAYEQVMHYCTLVLDVASPAKDSAEKVSAGEALKRARDARAIWHEFPGFTADVTMRGDDKQQRGRVTIDADGGVSLATDDSSLAEWAEEMLYSLVQHRMPDGEISIGDVRYADDEVDHPQGRKINLGDGLESAYRIKDDVITEVNRSMGASRFTISVLEVVRNSEGKYLPRSFVMSFFDEESGEMRGSLAHANQWQRVGKFDLPRRTIEISSRKGGATTKEIVFENCELMPGK